MSDIPIIINNFNRLTTTRNLCNSIIKLGYTNIIILDNLSTYPPLLDWYLSLSNHNNIKIHILDKNFGHKALWDSGYINYFREHPFIVLTDSDIELNPRMDKNFIETLINIANYFKFDKVGLSIELNDLPETEFCNKIKQIESIYWINKLQYRSLDVYQGMIDTTFTIVNPILPFKYPALRVAGDFTCRHIPWYLQFDKLSKEEQYMLDTADEKISTYKQEYLRWKEK